MGDKLASGAASERNGRIVRVLELCCRPIPGTLLRPPLRRSVSALQFRELSGSLTEKYSRFAVHVHAPCVSASRLQPASLSPSQRKPDQPVTGHRRLYSSSNHLAGVWAVPSTWPGLLMMSSITSLPACPLFYRLSRARRSIGLVGLYSLLSTREVFGLRLCMFSFSSQLVAHACV